MILSELLNLPALRVPELLVGLKMQPTLPDGEDSMSLQRGRHRACYVVSAQ